MLPMWFMLITTVAALGLMVRDNLINAAKPNWVLGGMAILLLVLALLMVLQKLFAHAVVLGLVQPLEPAGADEVVQAAADSINVFTSFESAIDERGADIRVVLREIEPWRRRRARSPTR